MFTDFHRKGHLYCVLRVFGYLKNIKNRHILNDSKYPIPVGGKDSLNLEFRKMFEDQYPDSAEEINTKV